MLHPTIYQDKMGHYVLCMMNNKVSSNSLKKKKNKVGSNDNNKLYGKLSVLKFQRFVSVKLCDSDVASRWAMML